ncbi:PTS sugar transporter subunit IIB [Erwinia sp. CPCC 100877]|nr:PTS sugar transporter subunit IIB [Erwinia sp. CPCC 100877]
MKKIVLLCSAGMSTSMLVTKMRRAAEEQNLDFDIDAYPLNEAENKGADADAILLGPQVRFQEASIKKLLPNKKVASINMQDYGTMNGAKVLNTAIELMEG